MSRNKGDVFEYIGGIEKRAGRWMLLGPVSGVIKMDAYVNASGKFMVAHKSVMTSRGEKSDFQYTYEFKPENLYIFVSDESSWCYIGRTIDGEHLYREHNGDRFRYRLSEPQEDLDMVENDAWLTKVDQPDQPDLGAKHDDGKLRWDLLAWEEVESVVAVGTMGASKYGDRNWENGIPVNKLIAAAFRHIIAFIKGKYLDDESGLPHLAHAAWNLLAIMWMVRNKPHLNDFNKIQKEQQ